MTTHIRSAWKNSPPLAVVCAIMSIAFLVSVAGIFLDARVITGVPAWVKPAKFAISTALFCGTMAWLFGFITVWPRFRTALGWILALGLVLEVAIIDMQAARGTTSHFNIATPLDASFFAVMGVTILILWLAIIGVFIALLRQKFPDRAWGLALRSAVLITIIGSALGGLMVRPTAGQSHARELHSRVTANGGHTVGGPDGGPGLPFLGWSTQHGDLRVAHFLGLHALQIVPLLALLFARRPNAFALTAVTAAGYLCLMAILTWQALHGQPFIATS